MLCLLGICVDRSEVGNDRFKTQLHQPADTHTVAANVKAWMASLGRKTEAGAISIDDSSRCISVSDLGMSTGSFGSETATDVLVSPLLGYPIPALKSFAVQAASDFRAVVF